MTLKCASGNPYASRIPCQDFHLRILNVVVCLFCFLPIPDFAGAARAEESIEPTSVQDPSTPLWTGKAYSPQITVVEQAWLAQHPNVTVRTDFDTPPYIFKDTQGNPAGVIVDLANHIETELGVRLTFVGDNYEGLVNAVKNASEDVTVLNDPLDAPYEEHYLKTRDFMYLPYSLWVRRDSHMLEQVNASFGGM
ncbi:MAG: transporter substrate-binding domain-containing protein, partial [Candidatus Hydrogenedentales bacterium]